MRKKSWFRVMAVLTVVLTFSLVTAGCYGKFALYQKVRDFNEEVEGKVPKSLVCAVFTILPVYGIAMFLDWILFNVIEYYSDENPMALNDTFITPDGKKAVMSVQEKDGAVAITVSIYEKDVLVKTVEITNNSGNSAAAVMTPDREVIDSVAASSLPSGSVLVKHGSDIKVLSEDAVASLATSL